MTGGSFVNAIPNDLGIAIGCDHCNAYLVFDRTRAPIYLLDLRLRSGEPIDDREHGLGSGPLNENERFEFGPRVAKSLCKARLLASERSTVQQADKRSTNEERPDGNQPLIHGPQLDTAVSCGGIGRSAIGAQARHELSRSAWDASGVPDTHEELKGLPTRWT